MVPGEDHDDRMAALPHDHVTAWRVHDRMAECLHGRTTTTWPHQPRHHAYVSWVVFLCTLMPRSWLQFYPIIHMCVPSGGRPVHPDAEELAPKPHHAGLGVCAVRLHECLRG